MNDERQCNYHPNGSGKCEDCATPQQECKHEWSDKGYCKRCDADRPDEVVEIGGETFKMRSKENGDVVLDHQGHPTPQQECEQVKQERQRIKEAVEGLRGGWMENASSEEDFDCIRRSDILKILEK